MNAPTPIQLLSLLFCALALASCADKPDTATDQNLKMETIRRPWGPTSYLYRPTSPEQ